MGRDSSNAHVKPSARQKGASVTRMEFDATPVATRIGAVTIMTMISFKQSIALDMYIRSLSSVKLSFTIGCIDGV